MGRFPGHKTRRVTLPKLRSLSKSYDEIQTDAGTVNAAGQEETLKIVGGGTTTVSAVDGTPDEITITSDIPDHDTMVNTHNLTTDIDHDTITNTHDLTADIDHGSIAGLAGDDHPHYFLVDATRAILDALELENGSHFFDYADGKFVFSNNVESGFRTILGIGGSSNAFPALVNNGAVLETRLADDSTACAIKALDVESTRDLIAGVNIGNVRVGTVGKVYWTNRLAIYPSATDGIMVMYNHAINDFDRLSFGGTEATFPAIQRSGTTLKAIKANASGYGELDAGQYIYGGDTNTYGYLPQADEAGFKASGVDMLGVDGGNDWVYVKSGSVKLPNGSLFTDTGDGAVTLYDSAMLKRASLTIAKTTIIGNTDDNQLIVRANSVQSNTKPLILLEKSDGTDIMSLHSDDVTNLFMGIGAGIVNTKNGTDGVDNFFMGNLAGNKNTSGRSNTFIGTRAGENNTTGYDNYALGKSAMLYNVGGIKNVAIGALAGIGQPTQSYSFNVLIGESAGRSCGTGSSSNVAIGSSAMRVSANSQRNTALGNSAFYTRGAGGWGVGIGHEAGYHATGLGVTLIGYQAAKGSTGVSSHTNTVAIGRAAGFALTTGSNNVLIGYQTGDNLTTGASNILIGYDIAASAAGVNNELNIGGLLIGDTSASTLDIHGSLGVLDSSDDGRYFREFHLSPTSVSPGASGATLTPGGPGNATLYWLMNATTEYLYFNTDIHDDWDEASDIVVEMIVALDGAETANDTIDAEIIAEYVGEHEDMDTSKTQTRTIAHDIVNDNGAGDVHHLTFIIDHDLGGNVVQKKDNMAFRFRLDSVASVAAIRFIHGNVFYRTKYPKLEIGTFPTEG